MRRAKPEQPVRDGIERFGRAAVSVAAAAVIDREGGHYGAGVIRGVSLATRGEARGHRYWLDSQTIDEVVSYAAEVQATAEGLKSRFTHPGMSSDGMGRALGRIRDVKRVGDQAVGDLHFYESARKTPDGDLADYVMSLAEEDPQAAGLSIVFMHDWEAEEEFEESHQAGREGSFVSPDPDNENHYSHVRIAELRAADVVDEPAANPNGLFDSAPLARQADELLAYAAGLSDRRPSVGVLGVDPDRAAQFFRRWAESRGLSIRTQEAPPAAGDQQMSEGTTQPAGPAAGEQPPITAEQFRAELRRFTDRFGAANAAEYLAAGQTYEQSLEAYCAQLQTERDAAIAERDEALGRLSSLSLGEDPIATGTQHGETGKKKFAEYVKGKPAK